MVNIFPPLLTIGGKAGQALGQEKSPGPPDPLRKQAFPFGPDAPQHPPACSAAVGSTGKSKTPGPVFKGVPPSPMR